MNVSIYLSTQTHLHVQEISRITLIQHVYHNHIVPCLEHSYALRSCIK